jgi:hypothetical protein
MLKEACQSIDPTAWGEQARSAFRLFHTHGNHRALGDMLAALGRRYITLDVQKRYQHVMAATTYENSGVQCEHLFNWQTWILGVLMELEHLPWELHKCFVALDELHNFTWHDLVTNVDDAWRKEDDA